MWAPPPVRPGCLPGPGAHCMTGRPGQRRRCSILLLLSWNLALTPPCREASLAASMSSRMESQDARRLLGTCVQCSGPSTLLAFQLRQLPEWLSREETMSQVLPGVLRGFLHRGTWHTCHPACPPQAPEDRVPAWSSLYPQLQSWAPPTGDLPAREYSGI